MRERRLGAAEDRLVLDFVGLELLEAHLPFRKGALLGCLLDQHHEIAVGAVVADAARQFPDGPLLAFEHLDKGATGTGPAAAMVDDFTLPFMLFRA